MIFGNRDCKEDCERVGKVCNKATGNCNKAKIVKKKPVSPPKPKIDKEMQMYLDIEARFERVNVPVPTLSKLKKFREEIIKQSKIREARLVVHWDSLTKAFKSVGKKMGIDVKKFDEISMDYVLMCMTDDELKEKHIIY
jgi:hypothetical protein